MLVTYTVALGPLNTQLCLHLSRALCQEPMTRLHVVYAAYPFVSSPLACKSTLNPLR